MKRITNFDESLARSESSLAEMDLDKVFRKIFPSYLRHYKASSWLDRMGTDYYVVTEQGTVQVDMKVLSRDPGWKSGWSSCLPIELWSVKDHGICGYEGNADYVLWVYRDSNRVVLAKRKELRDYVNQRRLEWMFFLTEYESQTRTWKGTVYTSSFVWLPFFAVAKQGFSTNTRSREVVETGIRTFLFRCTDHRRPRSFFENTRQ